ncbi:metal/formaldehyde-sensitive transcriptional repressor [Sphingomonas aerolata]|uniref:metal/formaldehyde-sensitive transcriptional repressor n=1 Tax=Sphingomonas aerolata TaxID=185951 RepID=UPI002FE351A0
MIASEDKPLLSPWPDKGLDRGFMFFLSLSVSRVRHPSSGLGVSTSARYTLGDYRSRGDTPAMSHVEKEKKKLLDRLKRLKGQIEGLERAIEQDKECTRVLQQATSCRGALDGFIAEVIEDHVREHMIDSTAPKDDPRTQAAEELVEIVHAYLT